MSYLTSKSLQTVASYDFFFKRDPQIVIKHLLLSPGEFVEVGVEFNIVVKCGASGQKTVKVFPTFTHIIQLQESVAARSSNNQPKKCSAHDATMSVKRTKVRQTLDIATHLPNVETDIKNTNDNNTNVPFPTDVSLPALDHACTLDKGKGIDRGHKKPSQTLPKATTSIMPAADVSKTPDKSHQLLLQLPKTKMLALQPKHSSMKWQSKLLTILRTFKCHILKVWFTYDNEPDRKATVGVVPLSSETADKVTTILFNFLRWTATLCDTIYDAQDAFCDKKNMLQYHALDLKIGDLVLMEVNIVHYKIKTDERQKALNRWVVYWTHLEFMRLSLLYCSNTTQENAEEDESVIPEFVL
ncbi:hypothetical protein SERLA73DRAFT_154032 [Serpula lacrymans var. lacrymans S7.3]|uniref:Uncharacterized protein n=1 Tax=Serpula lacrymans var. lacrymans (strain S7.3) TaxID=936435 RepID=F8Q3H1_SERL3|nr:hypothetical protein SERLA73DRAFT_154032 [Serpula lacrymans var. lacrymans S7.3]